MASDILTILLVFSFKSLFWINYWKYKCRLSLFHSINHGQIQWTVLWNETIQNEWQFFFVEQFKCNWHLCIVWEIQTERERVCIICSDIMNARGYVCQILNINTIIWSKFGKWSSFYLYNFKKILLILRLIGLSSQSSVIRMGDFHLRFFFNSL